MPQELPNDVGLRIFGNWEISGNCLNFIERYPITQSPYQKQTFANTSRNLLKNRN